jgi:ArsR family transcriptional regulator
MDATRRPDATRFVDPDRAEAARCNLVDRGSAEDISTVFRVLADPTRVAIIHALSLAELCNSDLAAILGLTESAVSHQMRELRLLKLVSAEKRGRMVYYRLTDTHIRHIFEDTFRHVREVSHGA